MNDNKLKQRRRFDLGSIFCTNPDCFEIFFVEVDDAENIKRCPFCGGADISTLFYFEFETRNDASEWFGTLGNDETPTIKNNKEEFMDIVEKEICETLEANNVDLGTGEIFDLAHGIVEKICEKIKESQ